MSDPQIWLGPLVATISLALGIWLFYAWRKPDIKPNCAARMMIATGTFSNKPNKPRN